MTKLQGRIRSRSVQEVLDRILATARLPGVPPAFIVAYEFFEQLLAQLILDGSTNEMATLTALEHELRHDDILACVRTNIIAYEFGRIVATIAEAPGEAFIDLSAIWPPSDGRYDRAVRRVVDELKRALTTTPVKPEKELSKRGRGRPGEVKKRSIIAMAARERIFPKPARDQTQLAPALAAVFAPTMTVESARRRLQMQRRSAPVPRNWFETVWAARVLPLQRSYFFPSNDESGELLFLTLCRRYGGTKP